VVESGWLPSRGAVAHRARRWQASLSVIRTCGAVVILNMARRAVRGRARELPADVARIARYARMGAGEWKDCFAVIEAGRLPCRSRMTHHAGCGNPSLPVIRVCRSVVILCVARVAIGRSRCEISVEMATRARHAYVRPGERERSFAVIEGGWLPSDRSVARRAGCRNSSLGVGWVCCSVVVFRVATVAIGRCALVFASDVARDAIQRGVCSRQGVSRHFQVIELCPKPAIGRMARLARRRKIQSRMAWVRGALKIFQVAGLAVR
jgi:hypothetical protein